MTANTDSMRYLSSTPMVSRPASSSLNGMGADGPLLGGGDSALVCFHALVSFWRIEVVRPSKTPRSSSLDSGAPPLRTDHAALPSSARTLRSANTDSTCIPSPIVVVP
jgi:hypothetical protein